MNGRRAKRERKAGLRGGPRKRALQVIREADARDAGVDATVELARLEKIKADARRRPLPNADPNPAAEARARAKRERRRARNRALVGRS